VGILNRVWFDIFVVSLIILMIMLISWGEAAWFVLIITLLSTNLMKLAMVLEFEFLRLMLMLVIMLFAWLTMILVVVMSIGMITCFSIALL